MSTFLISYGFQDSDGNAARCRVASLYSAGFATAEAFALACYNAMSTISGCAITDYTITYKYEVIGAPAAPGTSANEYLCCVVLLENGDVALQVIPGPLPDLFMLDQASGQSLYVVDMADTRIVDLAAGLVGTQSWYGVEVVGIVVAGLAY